jgi:hypothetical protein
MSAFIRLSNRVITNPIEWQETQHQLRLIPANARQYWFMMPMTMLVLVGAIALTLLDIGAQTRNMAIYVIWIVHIITVARAISAGANAISREHVGKTWDALVMTGVNARQILIGKWLGVLHRVAPWMLALGAVRLLMIPVFMLAMMNRFLYFASTGSTFYAGPTNTPISWVAWATVAAVIFTVILTVLEVMACTAIGLAASAMMRRGWTAMIVAFCIRFAPVVLFGAFTRYEVATGMAYRVLRFPYLSLADGGTAPLYLLSLPYTYRTQTVHLDALPSILMAGVLLGGMLVVALLVAWWAIRRDGALQAASS